MTNTTKLLTVFTVIALIIGATPRFSQADPDVSAIVSANSTFGFRLFDQIYQQSSDRNIFFSPFSISMALTMCYNGAANATEKAMAKTLALPELSLEQMNRANSRLLELVVNSDPKVQMNLANSLWADHQVRFRENFLHMNKEFYGAEITNLDLSAIGSIDHINQWIEKKTLGRIQHIITKEDLDAILFIINAIYFKAEWTVGFDRENTHQRDFTLPDGSKKAVPMMMSQSNRYHYYQGQDFQAVALPYGDEKVSLYLFLPNANSSLSAFQKKLNLSRWQSWMTGFHREDVQVLLPRLRLEYEINLNEALKALGMGVAFSHQANFSRMCNGSPVIDWVRHKAFIDVNEAGTEAAATTVVKMKKGGQLRLVFDRPFFLAIRDHDTGTILFLGSITAPQQ